MRFDDATPTDLSLPAEVCKFLEFRTVHKVTLYFSRVDSLQSPALFFLGNNVSFANFMEFIFFSPFRTSSL